jgi:hypothetical protein
MQKYKMYGMVIFCTNRTVSKNDQNKKKFHPSSTVLRIQNVFIPDLDPNMFPSRIRKFVIPDSGYYRYIKRGMKKLTFFLLLMASGSSFNSQNDNSSQIRIRKKFISVRIRNTV